MKLVLIRNLHGNEIIAKNIYDSDGKVLLHSGSNITKEFIPKLMNYGVYYVYVEDENLNDIVEDKYLSELKEETLSVMPTIFNDLLEGNIQNVETSMEVVENLIDYIIKEGSVNTNLYEVKTYDNYTYIHCLDTAIMTAFLGLSLDYKGEDLKNLSISALFHDIGKTKVPNELINKKNRLTEEEFEEIKNHTIYGKEILVKLKTIPYSIINGVLQHHEKFDGTGYPFGLKKQEISNFARIISVCDVFTAVSANRSYRYRFSPNEAYELILSGSGTQFDPNIVNKFRDTFAIYPLGCCVKLTNNIEGYVVKQNKNFPDRPIIRVIYDAITKKPITPYEINLINNLNIVIQNTV